MYSGITPTMTLRYINRMIGEKLQEIELSEEEIMRVVFQESLPTFSKFFPYKYKLQITSKDSLNSSYPNVYRIPNDDRLEIIGVHRVWLSNMNQFGGSLLPVVNDPYTSQLLNDYLSSTITPTVFEYQAPNIITIRPKIINAGSAMLELKAVHPRHLKTIPMNMRDEFLKLCLLDVLISIYPLRHRFESYTTVYGTISPFMEMIDNAASEKEALIERWRENLLRDSTAKRVWIA